MQKTTGQTTFVRGRIVWVSGKSVFEGQVKTIFGTQTPKLNDKGEQMKEYGFGLAVPKADLQQMGEGQNGHIWAIMHQEAQALYQGGQIPPAFAMKYKDGDGVDHNGKSFNEREGYAGHIVFTLTTSLPIQFFRYDQATNNNIMINEGIKCGDYVNAQVQVIAHGPVGQGKPGLYMNPLAVQFWYAGQEIINKPDGDQIFGGQAPAVPAGESAVPSLPQAQGFPAAGNAQQAAQQFPQAPQMAPQMAPQAAPAPHHGVLPQAMQPQVAPAPAPQVAPQAPAMPAMPAAPQAPQAAPAPAGFPPIPGQ